MEKDKEEAVLVNLVYEATECIKEPKWKPLNPKLKK